MTSNTSSLSYGFMVCVKNSVDPDKKPADLGLSYFQKKACNFLHVIFIRLKTVMDSAQIDMTWPQGYKPFFILNSAEHEIYPAHKC